MDPMLNNQREPQQTETDRMVGEIVIYGLLGMIGILFFFPALLGMLIFAIIHMFKRELIFYFALGVGIVILLWEFQQGNLLTYFGLISEMNIPYMSTGVESLLNEGNSIAVSPKSYVILVGLALIFTFIFFIITKFFWKKRVTTKSGIIQKQKAEQKYKVFRKNRVKFLNKKQRKYRKTPSKEVFVGYTDFKERKNLLFSWMAKVNENPCLNLKLCVKHTGETYICFLKWMI